MTMQEIFTGRTAVQALCVYLGALTTASTSHAIGAAGAPGQASGVEASYRLLAADNFDSSVTRLFSGLTLAPIAGYRISGEAEFGYRQTRDGGSFPRDLYRAGAKFRAAGARNRFEAGVVSASDQPFDSADEISLQLSGSREVKQWDRRFLHLGLFYSSRFEFPLPIFLYTRADPDLFYTIGLPIASVRWRASETTTVAASYRPVRQVRLAAEREISPGRTLILEGAIEEERYFLADRQDEDVALVLEVPRVGLAFHQRVNDQLNFGFSVGRSFAARYFEREGFRDEGGQENIAAAWTTRFDLKQSF